MKDPAVSDSRGLPKSDLNLEKYILLRVVQIFYREQDQIHRKYKEQFLDSSNIFMLS
jgi:hypothetical protein